MTVRELLVHGTHLNQTTPEPPPRALVVFRLTGTGGPRNLGAAYRIRIATSESESGRRKPDKPPSKGSKGLDRIGSEAQHLSEVNLDPTTFRRQTTTSHDIVCRNCRKQEASTHT